MKKLIIYLFVSFFYCNGFAQSSGSKDTLSIIPQPVSVSLQRGYFLLKPGTAGISSDEAS